MAYQYPFKDAEEKLKLTVWKLGKEVPNLDSKIWRKDKCGKLIKYSDHGDRGSKYGWEIDHIIPIAKNGTDDVKNLQPLHWENNVKKGDTYPWLCKNIKYLIRLDKLK
jgi:hypothetical protein